MKFMQRQREAIQKAKKQEINNAREAFEDIKRRKKDAKKRAEKSKAEVEAAFKECKLKFLELVLKQATYEARSDMHDLLEKAWLTMRGRLYRMQSDARRGATQAQTDVTTTEAEEEEEDASGE